jgi:hypothetical protein
MNKNYKIVFKRNGQVISNDFDLKKVTGARIKNAVNSTINDYVLKLREVSMDVLDAHLDQVNQRPLYDGTTPLTAAYKMAADKSKIQRPSGHVRFRFVDLKELDKLLPMSENSNNQEGGWWRMHEEGSPGSKVGASSQYGFVNVEVLEKIFGNDFNPDRAGRHKEGIMIDITKGIGKQLGFRPFRGVAPLRILARTILQIRSSDMLDKPFHFIGNEVVRRFI